MTSKSFFMSIFANVEYINSNYMTNLYWPIYKKIEKEIVELSNHIHFDDNQLSVYSVKIVELLIRCVVEIEAISKDLYLKNGGAIPAGRVLYYDTDCLNLLEGIWELSKKQVIVSSANFYFQDNNNKILYPLRKANKRSTSGADWAKAYQAVKHIGSFIEVSISTPFFVYRHFIFKAGLIVVSVFAVANAPVLYSSFVPP